MLPVTYVRYCLRQYPLIVLVLFCLVLSGEWGYTYTYIHIAIMELGSQNHKEARFHTASVSVYGPSVASVSSQHSDSQSR